LLAVVVLVAGVVLGGCSVPGPPTSVSPDVLASVLKAIQVGLGLKFFAGATQVEHRHKGFFVVRRAEALARLHPEWTQDPTFQQLIQRVSQDFAEVQIVINDLFKDGDPKSLRNPAPDGTSNTTTDQEFTCDADKHLDLDNVSKVSLRPAERGQALERGGDEEPADVLDRVGRDPPQDAVLGDALLGRVLVLDRVATTRVQQAMEPAARALGQIGAVDEHDVVAAQRGVPGHAGARGATANHQDIGAKSGHGVSLSR